MSDKSECMMAGAEEMIGHRGYLKQNFGWDYVTLEEAVYQAVGAASVCWSDGTNGVFEDGKARNVAEQLLARLRLEVEASQVESELCTTEEPKEWIERQDEERRAWAVGEAIRVIREADSWDVDSLIGVAEKIEAFVKGPQEDPDLHDRDALDAVYTFYAEDAKAGVDYLGSLGVHRPTAEEIEQAATNLIDKLTKAGVRFKLGKVIEED